ncbi:serine-rich adhesin for platelets isoform X1 [Lucilia sericata]|uniref:serine-rich adhesin for platelets isoform X1 n=2 Tax=Lucilia sericata TaxID=13632 RepID=UPI0018A8354E|nr:serine-rich adhesin for platelets isoform X1 [Lucilia sericata]
MLGCIYQLWDWLEAPPLFNAGTMDAKKLQQLQQAQHLQKKIPLAYQTNIADYRTTTHSPVFQQQQHANYHLGHVAAAHQQQYQQSPTTTSSSGPLTPIDIQPHASKLLLKHQLQSSGSGGSSAHSSPYHQASTSSGYPTSSTVGTGGTDQLYQSPTERTYLAASGRINSAHNQATNLQLQYQQLQQAKLQAQLATQNEAAQNQQRQFALRQMINPPVPQGHYHMSQSSSMMSTLTQQQQQQQQQTTQAQQQQQQQQQQRAPPSSLNLTNQFQPAAGPLKVTQQNAHKSAQHYHQQQQQQQQQEQIYGQHQHQQLQMQLHHQQQLQQHHHALQQRSKSDLQTPQSSDQSPIYIQQNHPGHVVNQAVQTQISTVAKSSNNPPQMTKTPSSEESSSASTKSPSHAPLDRKKSGGGSITNSQALKSPITKRPPNSPVTIAGWLYKQGSDGLKVWRKRWFVLAEYCLYYYKGPEEEKVLGSILLPSYKVSACLPEDKIYRKYAFKCEHQNMRTYWLAAENAESMVQWVRALSAATMMQAPSSAGESSEHPSGSSSLNHSGENSDSGIHTLQSQQSKMSGQGQVTPASDNGGVTTSSSSGAGGSGQPLYANAPPKPRRITDGGYSSPSPEHSIDNEAMRQHQMHQQQHQQQQSSRRSGIMSPTLQQMQQYQQQQQQSRSQHHAIYDTRTGNVSSAMRIPPQQQQANYPIDTLEAQYQQQLTLSSPDDYPQSPTAQYMDSQMEQQIMQLQQQRVAVDDIYGERELYMQRLIQQRYPPHMSAYVSAAERRTPDAYGRSKNRMFSDYEDIYNLTAGAGNPSAQEALMQEAASYRRPLSPPSYEGNKHVPSAMSSRYTPNNLESSPGHSAAGSNIRARPAAAIVRPHSADFLEYEARAEAAADAAAIAATASMIKPDPVRAPRPKSSLDINRTPDSFYYSEENYAEKMRKSALYLQNPQAQPQQAGTYRTTSGSTDFLSPVASGMNTIGYENPYERTYKRNELLQDALGNQAGHTSIPRMSRSQTMGNGSQIRSSSTHPHHSLSPPSQQQQQLQPEQLQLGQSPAYQQKQTSQSSLLSSGLTTQQIIQQNEQFLRSASARLPKRSSTFDDEPSSTATTPTTSTTVTSPPTGTTSPPAVAGGAGGLTQTTPTSHLDGERKREESMKRLLEWKQRMLQSPLTRKSGQHSTSSASQSGQPIAGTSNISAMSKLGSNPNILLASTAVASGAHYPNTVTTTKGGISSATSSTGGIQRSRSETHANTGPTAGYNSYSSDDEAGTIMKAPAGRSSLRAKTSEYGNNTSTKFITNTTSSSITNSTITKISTNTTQKPKHILTTSNLKSEDGHAFEKYNATNKLYNDSTIITRPKKTIAINDTQQQAQDIADYAMTSFSTGSTDSTFTATVSQTNATTPQVPRILKPILKTKIINVKPVPSETSPSGIFFPSELEDSLDSSSPLTKITLPKIPNAIAIALDEKTNNEPTSPQISSYVPVYNTKTVVPTKLRTISNNYENIEIPGFDFNKQNQPNVGESFIRDGKSTKDVEIFASDTETQLKCDAIEIKNSENLKTAEDLESIKNETEAIQDEEATPMLMSLKRFKEKEEKRLKLQLTLEETQTTEDDVITPTQEIIDSQKEDHTQHVLEEEEDDEDTTCEYTDDDLDEALAEEADVEEDTTMDTTQIDQDLADDKELSKIYENEPMTPQEHQHNLDESHYLPMTPKKIESDQSNNAGGTLTLVSLLDSTNEEEENHYVEMTKQLQDEDSKNNYEIMCLNNSSNSPSNETGCKPKELKIMNEPLYMELQGGKPAQKSPETKEDTLLPLGKTSTLKKSKKSSDTLKKKSKKSQQDRNQHKRKDLPDILKPPQNSMVLNSDSSDADDESSKHMDSKKMRSRTRFSLSDTFRPASYYLGASTPLNNCIESSDSEIVSPPPIPNSPPPMEELKTEEIFSAENYDTVKRRDSSSGSKFNISYEQLPKMHASNSSLNFAKNEAALKSSRLSLPDQFSKAKNLKTPPHLLMLKQHERTLSDSNYSFQTDNSSNNSSDFDLYNKLKQNSPSYIATPIRYQSNSSLSLSQQKTSLPGTGNNSETDTVELRHRQGSDSELERQRSRRPLSEESISEIESLSEKFEDALETADLDTYLNDLQNSDLYLYQNTKFETSATAILTDAAAAQGAGILTNLIKPPKIFRNKDDEHFYGNIHFVSSTDSLQKLEGPNDQFDVMGATSVTPTRYMTPLHSRNNSNISEQSVPYYYSELSSSRELLSTPTTLNNQRDIHAQGSNIDHIHNPIERAHNINMEILADKDQAIDSKNLYKMKTNVEKLSYSSGKNLKTGETFHHNTSNPSTSFGAQTFHIQQIQNPAFKINNYKINLRHQQTLNTIYGTNPNSQSITQSAITTSPALLTTTSVTSATSSPSSTTTTTHTSNMVCGNIETNAKNINLQMGNNALVAQNTLAAANNSKSNEMQKPSNNLDKSTVLGGPVSGELLWEEDTLWRESLRRVSQRHARSLDDLDRITVIPARITTLNRTHLSAAEGNRKPRLSRDVTYVNDNVSQHLRSSFKLRHSNPNSQNTYDEVCDDQSLNEDSQILTNDHDVYVQLNENILSPDDLNSDLYEVLREETSSNISSTKSTEIDRETIRQWDSMSSGLMKNSLTTTNLDQSPTTSSNVKSIIDQLNSNCDNNGNPNIMSDNK